MDYSKRESLAVVEEGALSAAYESPTQLWLNKRTGQVDGWGAEDIAVMPTEKYIKLEQDSIATHVSVCHATMKQNYVLDLFSRALSSDQDRHIAWIRPTSHCPRYITKSMAAEPVNYTIKDISQVKERLSADVTSSSFKSGAVDNTAFMAWHLLSCSPSLFQNADVDSMESAADYYFGNGAESVLKIDFKTALFEILDNRGLLIGASEQRNQLFNIFSAMFNNAEQLGPQNILYQYLIPHHLVNELLYISGKNGIVDSENGDALSTLCALKTEGSFEQIPHVDTLQVRLFVPKLLDPNIAKELVVVQHSTLKNHAIIDRLIYKMVSIAQGRDIALMQAIKQGLSALRDGADEPESKNDIGLSK